MSTDTWGQCPICGGKPPQLQEAVFRAYGNVSVEEYERLKRELQENSQSFSVKVYYDYALNTDLTVTFTLQAECKVCGAKWEAKK